MKLKKKEIEDLNNNSFNNMSLNEVFVDETFPNSEKDKVNTIYLNSYIIFVISKINKHAQKFTMKKEDVSNREKDGDWRQTYLKTLDDVEKIRHERDRLLSSNEKYKKVVEGASEQMQAFKNKMQENFLKECKKLQDHHNSSLTAFKNESFQKLLEKDKEIISLKDQQGIVKRVKCFKY
jgi:hypothetical protein